MSISKPLIEGFPCYEPTSGDAKTICRAVAQAFVERALAVKLTGAKRDNEAMAFFQGAHAAFHRESECAAALRNAIFLISVRGYSVVTDYAHGLTRGNPPA